MQLHGAWPDARRGRAAGVRPALRRAQPAVGRRSTSWPSCTGCAASSPGRGGVPPRPAGRPRAAARAGAAAPGAGAGRCRGGRDPARARRGRRTAWRAPRLLAAYVEIMLAAGDVTAARAAADELSALADAVDAPLLRAARRPCHGRRAAAEGDARAALGTLRRGMGGLAGARGALRGGARPGADRPAPAGGSGTRTRAEMEFDAALLGLPASSAPCPTWPGCRRSRARRRPAGGRADRARGAGAAPRGDRQDQPRRSPPSCFSARRPWPGTSATSSPSSACLAGGGHRLRLRARSRVAAYTRYPRRRLRDLGASPEEAAPPDA